MNNPSVPTPASTIPDNQLVLQRADASCQTLDGLRHQLYTLQKRIANAREQSNPQKSNVDQDKVMAGLLHEAYTLQFQLATLLSASEEPIPERQRIPKGQKSAQKSLQSAVTPAV